MKPFFVKVIGSSSKVYKRSTYGDLYIASFAFTKDANDFVNFKNATYDENDD